jgi:hypothetical protein
MDWAWVAVTDARISEVKMNLPITDFTVAYFDCCVIVFIFNVYKIHRAQSV